MRKCGEGDVYNIIKPVRGTSKDDARVKSDGWSTSYYELPAYAKELQDLIEYRNMDYTIGNIFKACYRIGHKDGNDDLYDANKILWFAKRKVNQIKRRNNIYISHNEMVEHYAKVIFGLADKDYCQNQELIKILLNEVKEIDETAWDIISSTIAIDYIGG